MTSSRDDALVAGGSVVGSLHRTRGINNQDAFHSDYRDGRWALAVADGCGSQPGSEVGAKLGAQLLTRHLLEAASLGIEWDAHKFLGRVRRHVLADLQTIWLASGGTEETLFENFLFTLVGSLVSHERTIVFILGDGGALLDGQINIQEAEDNAPPYMGYSLRGNDSLREGQLDFKLLWDKAGFPERIAIFSDGIVKWLEESNNSLEELFDELEGGHADSARRWLWKKAKEKQKINWEERRVEKVNSAFSDDATILAWINRRS